MAFAALPKKDFIYGNKDGADLHHIMISAIARQLNFQLSNTSGINSKRGLGMVCGGKKTMASG
ncbi:MAG: hypothetical protein HKO79_00075 [Desulfobacterales bacterium]|nr:hypothetical protein [Desulfobacterales bacterium]